MDAPEVDLRDMKIQNDFLDMQQRYNCALSEVRSSSINFGTEKIRLKNALQNSEIKNSELQLKVLAMERELISTQKVLDDANASYERLRMIESVNAHSRMKLDETSRKLLDVEREKMELTFKNKTLENQLQETETRLKGVKNAKATLDQNVKELSAAKEDFEKKCNDYKKITDQWESEISKMKRETREKIAQNLHELSEKNKMLNGRNEKLQDQVVSAREEIIKTKEPLDNDIKKKGREIKNLKGEVGDLKLKLEKTLIEFERFKTQNQINKFDLKEATEKRMEYADVVERLQGMLDTANQTRLMELEEIQVKLGGRVVGWKTKIELLENENKELREKAIELEKRPTEMMGIINELESTKKMNESEFLERMKEIKAVFCTLQVRSKATMDSFEQVKDERDRLMNDFSALKLESAEEIRVLRSGNCILQEKFACTIRDKENLAIDNNSMSMRLAQGEKRAVEKYEFAVNDFGGKQVELQLQIENLKNEIGKKDAILQENECQIALREEMYREKEAVCKAQDDQLKRSAEMTDRYQIEAHVLQKKLDGTLFHLRNMDDMSTQMQLKLKSEQSRAVRLQRAVTYYEKVAPVDARIGAAIKESERVY